MKLNKIFTAALAATILFASCAKDNGTNNPGNGQEIDSPTYATFSFNLSNGTRAVGEFEPTPQTEAQTNEKKIGTGDLYILVFNATTKALEYKSEVTNAKHTALLTAGQKKIFVLANIGAEGAAANVQANLKTVDPATLAASSTAATVASSLTVNTSTLDDLYKIAFDAGTPQAYDVVKTGSRTFSVAPLYTLVNAGTLGLPMSNNNAATFTLNANVTKENAELAGTPVENGQETYNRFKIVLDYMGAKARMVANPSGFSQTLADISNLKYTVKNLAKYTSLIQNVPAGVPQSIYHNLVYSSPTQATFQAHVDQASTANVDVAASATAAPYIYVPENTHATLLRGQSSFFALNVTYKPKAIVNTVDFDLLENKVKCTEVKSYDDLSIGTGTYIYSTEVVHGISVDFFRSARVFADAVWMSKNQKPISDGSYSTTDADALVAGKYKTFTNAQSWYRMDIGEGVGVNTIYGVLRGNAYTATVNNITGPGEAKEEDLFEKPEDPVSARTYINVTIEAKDWRPAVQSGDL